jgi:hypothetical protein
MRIIRLKPAIKKIKLGANPPADPNLPQCSVTSPKINIDKNARFRYLGDLWFR